MSVLGWTDYTLLRNQVTVPAILKTRLKGAEVTSVYTKGVNG